MDPKRYQRLKELVNEALAKPEYERDVFLQLNCDDPEMLAAARDLLHPSGNNDEDSDGHIVLTTDIPDL